MKQLHRLRALIWARSVVIIATIVAMIALLVVDATQRDGSSTASLILSDSDLALLDQAYADADPAYEIGVGLIVSNPIWMSPGRIEAERNATLTAFRADDGEELLLWAWRTDPVTGPIRFGPNEATKLAAAMCAVLDMTPAGALEPVTFAGGFTGFEGPCRDGEQPLRVWVACRNGQEGCHVLAMVCRDQRTLTTAARAIAASVRLVVVPALSTRA